MFKNINNSIYEILVNLFHDKNKNSIIEPLICLIRLAILEFKPLGTKISIFNNRITYNEPNLLQGAVRWSNGDTRDDLHNIFLPITKAGEWYSLDNEDIKNILIFAIRGLEKLKSSYSRNSTINHSIQYYISYLKTTHANGHTTNTKEDPSVGDNNTIFNKLKGIWNDREITIINNLLIELQEKRKLHNNDTEDESISQESYSQNEELETIINTLETLLISKENKVHSLIVKAATLLE